MPPSLLKILDDENRANSGAIERYIYLQFMARQSTVANMIAAIETANPAQFQLAELLALFVSTPGIRRSIDKAYEIITYALFETVVVGLKATVTVQIPKDHEGLLTEFAELARVLLGLDAERQTWTSPAHIYRVGVTNAADRGLDMWANFGAAIQVKHMTLDDKLATQIVGQVESDQIVIVCQDAHAQILQTVLGQIGWGQRVRGIVTQTDLINWFELCLRGKFATQLASPLLQRLRDGFKAEFPQVAEIVGFCEERNYIKMTVPQFWYTETDQLTQSITSGDDSDFALIME